MLNFKHKKTGKVIHPEAFKRLPDHLRVQHHFTATKDSPTHSYECVETPNMSTGDDNDEIDSFLTGVVVAELVEDVVEAIVDDSPAVDDSSVEADFGSGSGDGAGATSDY